MNIKVFFINGLQMKYYNVFKIKIINEIKTRTRVFDLLSNRVTFLCY